MENYWKLLPNELKMKILYYSIKQPLSNNIQVNIKNYMKHY